MSKQSTERPSNPPKVTQVGSGNSLEVVLLKSALYDLTHGAPGLLFELRLVKLDMMSPRGIPSLLGEEKGSYHLASDVSTVSLNSHNSPEVGITIPMARMAETEVQGQQGQHGEVFCLLSRLPALAASL